MTTAEPSKRRPFHELLDEDDLAVMAEDRAHGPQRIYERAAAGDAKAIRDLELARRLLSWSRSLG